MKKVKRIVHMMEQGGEAWFSVRLGKATSSNFGTIMANYGKAFGEPAKKYAMKVALEGVTGKRIETYSNALMERGIELEPQARSLYEENMMESVREIGFVEFGRYGSSPDGLVGDKGGIEVKSVIYSSHFANIQNGYDKSYKWQLIGNMWICELDWINFTSYCPEFPEDRQLHVFRVDRDEEEIKKLQSRLAEFDELVDKYKTIIKGDQNG